MKNLVFVLLIIFAQMSLGQGLKVLSQTDQPVVNQSFEVEFSVSLEGISDSPLIEFSKSGLELVDKRNGGITSKVSYINGVRKSSKEVSYIYEFVPTRTGRVRIYDIQAKVGDQTYRSNDLNLNVVSRPREILPVFLKAEGVTDEIYENQGVLLNFYLYMRARVIDYHVKNIPKLSDFQKRFLNVDSKKERVTINGVLHERVHLYSTVVFPNKKDEVVVDPMVLNVTYLETDRNDPFSTFGFGSTRRKSRTIQSEQKTITIKKLPTSGLPASFTGIVGEVDFELDFPKTKYLSGEPIEFKMIVQGIGNLEKFPAPKLIDNANIEEFEINSEIENLGEGKVRKVFNYTYIGRNGVEIPPKNIEFSYFSLNSEVYQKRAVQLPKIEIRGGAISNSEVTGTKAQKISNEGESQNYKVNGEYVEVKYIGPFWMTPPLNKIQYLIYIQYLILSLSFARLLIRLWKTRNDSKIQRLLAGATSPQSTLGDTVRLLEYLRGRTMKATETVFEEVDNLPVSTACKSYFRRLIEYQANLGFNRRSQDNRPPIDKKYFAELIRNMS